MNELVVSESSGLDAKRITRATMIADFANLDLPEFRNVFPPMHLFIT